MGVRNHPTTSSQTPKFPTPNLRYVLPDEVAFSLGQGQRRRRQSATCLQKSLHRFLWIPFFISLLEPLVLRLFLFYASVIFFKNYHLSASLMKTNKFHYTFPLLMLLIPYPCTSTPSPMLPH